MAIFFCVILTEVVNKGSVCFQWNGRVFPAEIAFNKLAKVIEIAKLSSARVVLTIKGRLGRDVRWESSGALTHTRIAIRHIFTGWYTQAVQAQAALARQRVALPSFTG